MPDQDKPKGAVRRFFDLLVGGEREDSDQRFDVRLARRLIGEMNNRILPVAATRFAPTIYRVTLSSTDFEAHQLDQGIVVGHYESFTSAELAHEIGRTIGADVPSDDVTVSFASTSHLQAGKMQIESWYGALADGDTGDVVDAPSISAEAVLNLFRRALGDSSLKIAGKTFAPRYYAAWFNPDDHRFWTQYPHIFEALQAAVLGDLVAAAAEASGEKADPSEFHLFYHADDKVGHNQMDIFASLDPIEITEDGSATSDSPTPSSLTSDAIVAEFKTQLRRTTIAIGKEILVPYYYIGTFNSDDYAYWTHYPEVCDELVAHIRQSLADSISEMLSGRIDEPISPTRIKLGLTTNDNIAPGTISVEASLDPIDIPEEAPSVEMSDGGVADGEPETYEPEPADGDDEPDESEIETDMATPRPVVEEEPPNEPEPVEVQSEIPDDLKATVAEREPVRDVRPLLRLVVADDDGKQTVHDVAVLPVTVGRTGGTPEPDSEFLALSNVGAVSRRHFLLRESGGGMALRLAEKVTNRTLLNDVPLTPGTETEISDGDTLRVGLCTVGFSIPMPAGVGLTANALRDALQAAASKHTITFQDLTLAPTDLVVFATEANCAYWRARVEALTDSIPGTDVSLTARPSLAEDELAVEAYWRVDDERKPAFAGPPAATVAALQEELSTCPGGSVSATLSLSPSDHDYWTQHPDLSAKLAPLLAEAAGCPVTLRRSSSLPEGAIEVQSEQPAPEAPKAGHFAIVTLEVRNRGDLDKYPIEKAPALIGREGGRVADDVYYVQLRNVREVSRKHFVLGVVDGSLTISVVPDAVNPVRTDSGKLPAGSPVPVEFDQDLYIGQIRITLRAPDPPFGSYTDWQNQLEMKASEAGGAGDLLTVMVDPVSHRFWTGSAQIRKLFCSMAGRAAVAAGRVNIATMSTRADTGDFSGFHVEVKNNPDPRAGEPSL